MEGDISLEDKVRGLLESRSVAVLATQGAEYPHACLVAFVASKDLKHLYFVTRRSTRKFQNMESDGRVMLLVDDRANTEGDLSGATVITGRGRAAPLSGREAQEVYPAYLERHPSLEEFARDPGSVLVRVEVDSYAVVSRFQELVTLAVDQGRDEP